MADNPYVRIQTLSQSQQNLVSDVIGAFEKRIATEINPHSDICTTKFSEDFQNRLVLYHAMNEEALSKKTFEYALRGACRFDKRIAHLDANPTNPGTDIDIDGEAFSLKTEAAKSISRKSLTISKLMEARWIRECQNGDDYLRGVCNNIVTHLQQYQRILMLRAFGPKDHLYEYHLIEIPLDILLHSANLSAPDFKPRTKNGSSGADVKINGQKAFSLILDGSVEKVTIRSLDLQFCKLHGKWIVPIISV